jgi:hypothetical protein
MKVRNIALAIATIAVLAPAISNASPEKAALDACAHAFASSLSSPGSSAPVFKVNYRSSLLTGSTLEMMYARKYNFELHANDEKTGLLIARANCSADAHGAVVAFSAIPPQTVSPSLAARF